MKPYQLDQLDALADGSVLQIIRGTLTSLWERKSGEHSNGPWAIQNGALTDSAGHKVDLQFKDRDPVPEHLKGKEVVMLSVAGDKGTHGVKVFDDEYPKGTIKRKIRITPTANIIEAHTFDGQNGHAADQAQGEPAQAPTQQEPTSSPQQASSYDLPFDHPEHPDNAKPRQQQAAPAKQPAQQTDGMKEARRTITQITNLHILCSKAVNGYEAPAVKAATGAEMSESQRQGATASIFIEACKNGLVRQMPHTAIKDH